MAGWTADKLDQRFRHRTISQDGSRTIGLLGSRLIEGKVPTKLISNVSLLLLSTIAGLLAVELGLRVLYPISMMNVETHGTANSDRAEMFLPDRALGWRPALGTHLYDESGIIVSRSVYPKAVGVKVLLIGDSVTARAKIVNGLAKFMPAETFLNGGVEGYNIEQEIEFFFRYQRGLSPDVIIHQMHINDLRPTRYLMRQSNGTVRSYSPRLKEIDINPTLYRYSQLYRFLVANLSSLYSKDELKSATADSLRRMRDYTREHGIAYHLVLFPILEPLTNWKAHDKETRDFLLHVARELGLDVVDLLPVAERMIAAGIDPKQRPRDTWHPNHRMGDAAADYMMKSISSLRDLQRD